MPMAIFMKVNGRMTRLTVREATPMLTEPPTLENGKTISNTAKESRLGQMEPNTKVNTSRARSMERAL